MGHGAVEQNRHRELEYERLAGIGANSVAMFVLAPGKELEVVVAGDRTELHEGQELIGLRG